MKVLQINATYGRGSTGVIVRDIDELARNNGIESFVAAPFFSCLLPNGFKIGNILDRKCHAVLSRLDGRQGFYSRSATKDLIKYIKKLNPDIVHLHNLHSNYIDIKVLLQCLKDLKCQVIITQHDCWLFTGKCFHYSSEECYKWETGCKNCPRRFKDTPAYLFDATKRAWEDKKKALTNLDDLTVVCVSNWLKQETKRSFLNGKDIRMIHNGVDLSVFKPQNTDIRERYGLENKFVILGMANKWLLPRNKEITETLLKTLPGDCKIILLGCNKKQQTERLKDEIRLGYIKEPKELAQIYSSADVFVNLSWEDSLPTVNLEAMACGTPVIAQKLTGISETIDETTGFLIEAGNIQQLLGAINVIKQKGKENYTLKCILKAQQSFDKNVAYLKYLELYKEVIGDVERQS